MDIQDGKRLLQAFFTMLQHMPIMYRTFSYEKSDFKGDAALITRIKRRSQPHLEYICIIADNMMQINDSWCR